MHNEATKYINLLVLQMHIQTDIRFPKSWTPSALAQGSSQDLLNPRLKLRHRSVAKPPLKRRLEHVGFRQRRQSSIGSHPASPILSRKSADINSRQRKVDVEAFHMTNWSVASLLGFSSSNLEG